MKSVFVGMTIHERQQTRGIANEENLRYGTLFPLSPALETGRSQKEEICGNHFLSRLRERQERHKY